MMEQLRLLHDEILSEIDALVAQRDKLNYRIDLREEMARRLGALIAQAPANPVPTATRQPRRNLQNLVLAQITSHPQSAEFLRSLVERAAGTAVTDSSVKRVLDALVKNGKIETNGRGQYFLTVPVTGEPRAAE